MPADRLVLSRSSVRSRRYVPNTLAPPVDPSRIAGIWLATDLVLADGAPVGAANPWPAHDGLGPTLDNNTGGSAPTFAVDAFGPGHPGVQFANGSILRKIGGLTGFLDSGVDGCTIIGFARQDSIPANATLGFVSTASQSLTRFSLRTSGTGTGNMTCTARRLDADASQSLTGGGPTSDAYTDTVKAHTFAVVHDLAGARAMLAVDGCQVNIDPTWLTAGLASATTPAAIGIGCNTLDAASGWVGPVGCVIIVEGSLSLGEVARFHQEFLRYFEQLPTPTETPTALPWDLNLDAMKAAGKPVIANWFPPYPLSPFNQGQPDTYENSFLNPAGQGGAFSAEGGMLRERPIVEAVSSTSTWKLDDCVKECYRALTRGIDTWGIDILSLGGVIDGLGGTSNNWQRCLIMCQAAALTGMTIAPMFDETNAGALDYTAAQVADAVRLVADFGNTLKDSSGRIVVQIGAPEYTRGVTYWAAVNAACTTRGVPVALFPMPIADWASASSSSAPAFAVPFTAAAYDPEVAGYTWWASASPVNNATGASKGNTAKSTYGKPWMAPIRIQDTRPNQHNYFEACNTENIRLMFTNAMACAAEYLHYITWNDYSENALHTPTQRCLSSWLDFETYWLAWYKLGTPPVIVRDAVAVSHRNQRRDAVPVYTSTAPMVLRTGGSAARDTVEVVVFLTAPATVETTVGGVTTTDSVGAGMTVLPLKTLQPGVVSVAVKRAGSTVVSVVGRETVSATPPKQDLNYLMNMAVA